MIELPYDAATAQQIITRNLIALRSEAAAMRSHFELPCPNTKWLEQRFEKTYNGIEETFRKLETSLQDCFKTVENAETIDEPAYVAAKRTIKSAKQLLAEHHISMLAPVARDCRLRVQSLCARIASQVGVCFDDNSEAERRKELNTVNLSKEQRAAVTFPNSILIQGRSGTGKTLVLVQRIVHQQQTRLKHSQLFVTKSALLRDEVIRQLNDFGCAVAKASWPPEGLMCCTWDQVTKLLQGGRRAAINFECFVSRFWPRIRAADRDLPVELIWSEFSTRLRPMGLTSMQGVSLKEYLEDELATLGICLTTPEKKALHTMFQHYNSLKKMSGEYDDVDLAQHLYHSLSKKDGVRALYVDEAQDFLPSQLFVLLRLCVDADGITIAGDTCQTITLGSSFNFQDILDMFSTEAARSAELHILRYNYRCEEKVASLANAVTSTILQQFPTCADHIDEICTASQEGKLPMFVEAPGERADLFLMGKGRKQLGQLDLARAVVLVRNDDARQILRQYKIRGTILTVAEAKGLEFDFIIMCNLLGDCPNAAHVWALADPQSRESELACTEKTDPQNRMLYAQIALGIREWKYFYVAITRARTACAILEFNHDSRLWSPVLEQLTRELLVTKLSGCRQYAFEVDSDLGNGVAESQPESHEEMLTWLNDEVASRRAPFHKKSRVSLNKEISRIRIEPWSLTFYIEFQKMHGPCLAELAKRVPDDIPAVASAMVANSTAPVCTNRNSHLRELKSRGMQLFKHALDNPRDRWQVFEEARLMFSLIVSLSSSILGQAAQDYETKRSRFTAEVCQMHSFGDFFFLGHRLIINFVHFLDRSTLCAFGTVSSRVRSTNHNSFWGNASQVHGIAEPGNLLAAPEASHLDSEKLVNRQIFAIIQEVCMPITWRARSSLSKLNVLRLWEVIFSFLTIRSYGDLHNLICLSADTASEHLSGRREAMSSLILAKAWHLLSKARYDTTERGREQELMDALESSAHDSNSLLHLHASIAQRRDACDRAGRAFLAVDCPEHAAAAFVEAADADRVTIQLGDRYGYNVVARALGDNLVHSRSSLHRRLCASLTKGGNSWLLAAQSSATISTKMLHSAVSCFEDGAQCLKAAICAASCGDSRRCLANISKIEGRSNQELHFTCAVLLRGDAQADLLVTKELLLWMWTHVVEKVMTAQMTSALQQLIVAAGRLLEQAEAEFRLGEALLLLGDFVEKLMANSNFRAQFVEQVKYFCSTLVPALQKVILKCHDQPSGLHLSTLFQDALAILRTLCSTPGPSRKYIGETLRNAFSDVCYAITRMTSEVRANESSEQTLHDLVGQLHDASNLLLELEPELAKLFVRSMAFPIFGVAIVIKSAFHQLFGSQRDHSRQGLARNYEKILDMLLGALANICLAAPIGASAKQGEALAKCAAVLIVNNESRIVENGCKALRAYLQNAASTRARLAACNGLKEVLRNVKGDEEPHVVEELRLVCSTLCNVLESDDDEAVRSAACIAIYKEVNNAKMPREAISEVLCNVMLKEDSSEKTRKDVQKHCKMLDAVPMKIKVALERLEKVM